MFRKTLLVLTPVAALGVLVAAAAEPAPVGAPFISLEVPANPLDAETRGAAFLVHTYYHENAARFPVAGTAEGIVDGERRSIPLDLAATRRPGVYAVRQQWPTQGEWVLAMHVGGGSGPSLLVELGPNGGVQSENLYGQATKVLSLNSVRVVSGQVDAARIDKMLRLKATATDE